MNKDNSNLEKNNTELREVMIEANEKCYVKKISSLLDRYMEELKIRKDEIKQKGYEIRTVKEDNELKEITRKLQKLLFFKGEIESLVNDNLFYLYKC